MLCKSCTIHYEVNKSKLSCMMFFRKVIRIVLRNISGHNEYIKITKLFKCHKNHSD
jgi:hypothetical protein